MNTLFAQAQAQVEESGVDQSVASAGFERKVTPEGLTPARFVGYVELGDQIEEFDGKAKDPAPQVRLTFELNGPAHKNSFEKDGVTKEWNNTISIDIPLSQNEKANFFKLFNKMTYGRDAIKHMTQMLGEAFIVKVVHKISKSSGKPYPILKEGGEWQILAPFQTDPMTGKVTNFDIAEMTEAGQVFMWANPSKEMWDSIYIDGSYTKKVDDKEVEVSKNFIQKILLEATNFSGSPLESLLAGSDMDLSIAPKEEAPVGKPETAAPVAAAETSENAKSPSNDPLAGLML